MLRGAGLAAKRAFRLALWGAYHAEVFARKKRLSGTDLTQLLSKLDPPRVMSNKEIRKSLLSMAEAMGAKVVRRTKQAE